MCIFHLTAIFVASEAMVSTKQPQVTSGNCDLNYIHMFACPSGSKCHYFKNVFAAGKNKRLYLSPAIYDADGQRRGSLTSWRPREASEAACSFASGLGRQSARV